MNTHGCMDIHTYAHHPSALGNFVGRYRIWWGHRWPLGNIADHFNLSTVTACKLWGMFQDFTLRLNFWELTLAPWHIAVLFTHIWVSGKAPWLCWLRHIRVTTAWPSLRLKPLRKHEKDVIMWVTTLPSLTLVTRSSHCYISSVVCTAAGMLITDIWLYQEKYEHGNLISASWTWFLHSYSLPSLGS